MKIIEVKSKFAVTICDKEIISTHLTPKETSYVVDKILIILNKIKN